MQQLVPFPIKNPHFGIACHATFPDISKKYSAQAETMTSIEFYDRNADTFFGDTVATDMTPVYERFLPLIRPGGRILDAGCGSGRDTAAFIQRGYSLDAFDGSQEMARRAAKLAGIPIKQMRFEDLLKTPLERRYDGIWCCASLLHVQREELPRIFAALLAGLLPGGIMYLSFKYGDTSRMKDGRYFTDLNEENLEKLVTHAEGRSLLQYWISTDQRPTRADEWLNAIVRIDK